jgi:hypothetical protein
LVFHALHLARALRRLEKWSRICPENFESYARIVRGELRRALGRTDAATADCDRAIAAARSHGAPKREAIACELASAHARARGDATAAGQYRIAAAYRRWGATAKARALEDDRCHTGERRPSP